MKYMIIGNSAAGVSAIEAIRSVDKINGITVVSKDLQPSYSPALTTYFISGKIDEKNVYFRNPEFYQNNKVKLMLGEEAKAIDPRKKLVTLNRGKKEKYDKLLIAVGAKPVVPPIEGVNKKGVFTLRNLDDAKAIIDYARGLEDVLVIGGGLVGLRAGYALEQRGLSVTVVELAPQILPQNLDRKAADIVKGFLKEKGWDIMTGKSVSALKGKSRVESAVLSDGRQISAPMVIIGTGVAPDVELAKIAGVKAKQGIVVDRRMRVRIDGIPDSGIYAAGDIVEARDVLLSKDTVNAIWPLARKQGRIAGLNMAGGDAKYKGGFPMNSVDFYGLTTMSVGRNDLPGTIFKTRTSGNFYKRLGFKDNKLVSFTLVGNVDRAGLLTGLIREQVDVSCFKKAMLEDDFGFLSMPKELRKSKLLKEPVSFAR